MPLAFHVSDNGHLDHLVKVIDLGCGILNFQDLSDLLLIEAQPTLGCQTAGEDVAC